MGMITVCESALDFSSIVGLGRFRTGWEMVFVVYPVARFFPASCPPHSCHLLAHLADRVAHRVGHDGQHGLGLSVSIADALRVRAYRAQVAHRGATRRANASSRATATQRGRCVGLGGSGRWGKKWVSNCRNL